MSSGRQTRRPEQRRRCDSDNASTPNGDPPAPPTGRYSNCSDSKAGHFVALTKQLADPKLLQILRSLLK